MPVTTNVNKLSVVHAGSTGMAISFPDPCKTPTPAGPVPIPYPNIAQSADTSKGSKTVKVDGNPIMLKNSEFKRSSGDEAGTAKGVMSNNNMGGAKFLVYSFDVKFDGQNVSRLSDAMQTNCGTANNTVSPAELQMPIPEIPGMPEECQKLKEKETEGEEIASKNSGMLPKHFDQIKDVVKQLDVVLYIRQTKKECLDWIDDEHQPKPHKVFLGNTIAGDKKIPKAQKWLDEFKKKLEEDARDLPEAARKAAVEARISKKVTKAALLGTNAVYASDAEEFQGVVGGQRPGEKMEPLKAVAGGVRIGKKSYAGKWITADYDLFQVLNAKEKCDPVDQNGEGFTQLKVAINKTLGWDAIQHGPQAQWVATEEDVKYGAPPGVNFPEKISKGLEKGKGGHEETVKIEGRNPMNVFDEDVTVIAPGGTVYLESREETFDALKCRECE